MNTLFFYSLSGQAGAVSQLPLIKLRSCSANDCQSTMFWTDGVEFDGSMFNEFSTVSHASHHCFTMRYNHRDRLSSDPCTRLAYAVCEFDCNNGKSIRIDISLSFHQQLNCFEKVYVYLILLFSYTAQPSRVLILL